MMKEDIESFMEKHEISDKEKDLICALEKMIYKIKNGDSMASFVASVSQDISVKSHWINNCTLAEIKILYTNMDSLRMMLLRCIEEEEEK